MAGRKPLPTKIHELRGNPGKRKRNRSEPKPKVTLPECPAHLDDRAVVEWDRISTKLAKLGLLTELDRAVLSAYCAVWSRMVDAEEHLARFGTVIKSPSGYPIQSPYLSIANRAIKQIEELSGEFGMTPSTRTRVMGLEEEGPDEFNQFLARAADR